MRAVIILFVIVLASAFCAMREVSLASSLAGQGADQLTPLQREIEKQSQRLSSLEPEDRRDALIRLGNLHRQDASRAAAAALNDVVPSVRVSAAHAIVSLPSDEAARLLIPLLQDRFEFVRREGAYALGETRSRSAVGSLANLLLSDKEAAVRGAAAMALGQIADESAVPALSQVLPGTQSTSKKKKAKTSPDEFVMRAAARSLGQIRSRAAVEVLIATLSNQGNPTDVRREAATALGVIGDPSAMPALRAAFASDDPYLSDAARAALRKVASSKN